MSILAFLIFFLIPSFAFSSNSLVNNSNCLVNGLSGNYSFNAPASLAITPLYDGDLIYTQYTYFGLQNGSYQYITVAQHTNIYYPDTYTLNIPSTNTVTSGYGVYVICSPPPSEPDPITVSQPVGGNIQIVSNDNFSYACGPTQSDSGIYWGCGGDDNYTDDDQYCCCDDDAMQNCGLGTWTPVNYTLGGNYPSPGESINISVTPFANYMFSSLTVNDVLYSNPSINFTAPSTIAGNSQTGYIEGNIPIIVSSVLSSIQSSIAPFPYMMPIVVTASIAGLSLGLVLTVIKRIRS